MLIDSDKAIETIDEVRDLISVTAYCAITERLKMIPTANGDLISRAEAIARATHEGAYGYISAQELAELPSAEPNILDDGTLTITVQNGMLSKVNRVIVDEVGTKFCKMMYQDALPSADRVGKWIDTGKFGEWWQTIYRCSECGKQVSNMSNYCPDCGAKMEGEGE